MCWTWQAHNLVISIQSCLGRIMSNAEQARLKRLSFGHSRLKQNRLCEMPGWEGVIFSANAFATSQMEQALDKWVSENLSLEAMLKLPEDSFKQKRAELLEVLKATLQDYKTSLTLEDVQTARLKVMEEGRLFYSL